jgi:hypothetical protein
LPNHPIKHVILGTTTVIVSTFYLVGEVQPPYFLASSPHSSLPIKGENLRRIKKKQAGRSKLITKQKQAATQPPSRPYLLQAETSQGYALEPCSSLSKIQTKNRPNGQATRALVVS